MEVLMHEIELICIDAIKPSPCISVAWMGFSLT